MDPETVAKKNLDLHAEWMRYLFAHPEVMDQIPEGAHVIILPTDDSALAEENAKLIDAVRAQDVPVVVVHLTSPKPPTPQIEVLRR
jgi:hypothetical protein